DELSEKELKQIEADDQAIQTILLGHPKDIYVAVDSLQTPSSGSPFFWQWEHPPLAVGTYTASGNSLLAQALGLEENNLICGGHYVTKIAHSLGYLKNKEVAKCSEPIECETWTTKGLAYELDEGTHSLIQTEQEAPQPGQARKQSQEQRGPSFEEDHFGGYCDSYHAGSIVPSSMRLEDRQQDSVEMILIRLCIWKIAWKVTMMKYEIDCSDIGIQENKAKLFNEWERFISNDGESIESYYHCFLKLMNDLKRNKHFPKKITNYTQLYDFLKYNQKEVDDLKDEQLTRTQDPLALMASSNNPYTFPVLNQYQPSFNQNYMQQPMPNLEDITDPTTTMNMLLALMAKAFKLNYSTPTNNNQRISSNPHNRQIAQPDSTTAMNMALALMAKAFKSNYSTPTNNNQRISSNPRNRLIAQPGMNMGQDRQMQTVGGNGGNQFRQYAVQNAGNLNGYNAVQNVRNQNQIGNGNLVAVRAEGNAVGHNGNQLRCYNCMGVGHFARDCIVRPGRRDAAYLQTQLLIA
nr:hypothetical protein [Tanacetum cinerariifolium]